MSLISEKEKIKRALGVVDDIRIIFGIKGYIEQFNPNDEMGENYIPQRAKQIDIVKEKKKIIEAVEESNEKTFLGGIKWFILLYEPGITFNKLSDAPIAHWEIAMPFGRKLTRKQLNEHFDIDDDKEEKGYSMEEVLENLKRHKAERKKYWDSI